MCTLQRLLSLQSSRHLDCFYYRLSARANTFSTHMLSLPTTIRTKTKNKTERVTCATLTLAHYDILRTKRYIAINPYMILPHLLLSMSSTIITKPAAIKATRFVMFNTCQAVDHPARWPITDSTKSASTTVRNNFVLLDRLNVTTPFFSIAGRQQCQLRLFIHSSISPKLIAL